MDAPFPGSCKHTLLEKDLHKDGVSIPLTYEPLGKYLSITFLPTAPNTPNKEF